MKDTVYLHTFRDAFQSIRPNNFSYEGLEILFNHLSEYEDSTGQELELDVIAFCCDFSEEPWRDVAENYSIDLDGIEDEDEQKQAVADYINDNGYLCGETADGSFVYQVF